ncbi:MAG: ribosome biogenesis GTPase YlqF [Clostridiales bacterium]|nr:ribosome biogenesis GTPase YlqF [Clostridiales bacterium]
MVINWYPGHMTKTRRMMEDSLKLVDAVCEVVDARIPESSRNPDIETLVKSMPRMIVLNRCDQADSNATARWKKHYASRGYIVIETDSKTGAGTKAFNGAVRELLKDKIARSEAKGQNRTLRLMIVGIPNVGKSSLINRLSGRRSAKAEDRPGVTRGKQWISLRGSIELLDTPGILWPKIEDREVALALAFTGAIKNDVMDIQELAFELVKRLTACAPESLENRYNIELSGDAYEDLKAIGRKRGFLISGGEVDTDRASKILLDEYRGGKLGRITLEEPIE